MALKFIKTRTQRFNLNAGLYSGFCQWVVVRRRFKGGPGPGGGWTWSVDSDGSGWFCLVQRRETSALSSAPMHSGGATGDWSGAQRAAVKAGSQELRMDKRKCPSDIAQTQRWRAVRRRLD